jgi:hypothetical protein
MNLKTTIVLILLAAGAAALFWKGPEFGPRLGLAPRPPEVTDRGTTGELAQLKADDIIQISVQVGGRDLIDGLLELTGGKWHQQGKSVPVATLSVPRQIALTDKVLQEKATDPRAQ